MKGRVLSIALAILLSGAAGRTYGQEIPKGQRAGNRASAFAQIQEIILKDHALGDPIKCGLPMISAAFLGSDTNAVLKARLNLLLQRPSLQKSILAGGFRIHYDTTGTDAPAMLDSQHQPIPGTANEFADSVAAILQYVLRYQTDTLGYLPPPSDNGAGGGNEYDIYVQNLSNLYGATFPDSLVSGNPDGGRYTTFITIDNDFSFVTPDSNKGLPGLRVTLSHELHHAIQLGRYGYWPNDVFFYEITSVWMEDVVFTRVNDYYQYLQASQGHFRRPEVTFNSSPLDFIMYSRGIWGQFIEKKYGRQVMRRAWEEIQNARPLEAMNTALQSSPYFSSLREAFGKWTLWNYFTGGRYDSVNYYPEGRYYPGIFMNAVGFAPPSRSISGSLPALSGKYYQVILQTDTLALILGNVNASAAIAGTTSAFPYTYLLDTLQLDPTYKPTPVGIFVKLDVADPANWYSSDGVSGGVGPSAIVSGIPYPAPFFADGKRLVYVPINDPVSVAGTLSIYSSSMDFIYSSTQVSIAPLGKQAFSWNGRTDNGRVAETGVYIFVLEVAGDVHMGKIALIRK